MSSRDGFVFLRPKFANAETGRPSHRVPVVRFSRAHQGYTQVMFEDIEGTMNESEGATERGVPGQPDARPEPLQDQRSEIRDDIRVPAIPLSLQPIKEFLNAFTHLHTYTIHKNIHAIFGLIWGLSGPLLVLLDQFIGPGTPSGDPGTILQQPVLLFFCLAYPVFSTFVFGAMGTIRKEKTRRIENYLERLEELTMTDPLTGLYNHRYIWMRLEEEIEEAKRHDRKLSVLMCDIDGFKEINDNFGHDVGDRCLKSIGGLLRDVCRKYDVVARYGGDEFVFILPDSNRDEAEKFADRISSFLDQTHPILDVDGEPLALGLSIGVSTFPEDGPRPEDIMKHADEEMYHHKVGNNEARTDRESFTETERK